MTDSDSGAIDSEKAFVRMYKSVEYMLVIFPGLLTRENWSSQKFSNQFFHQNESSRLIFLTPRVSVLGQINLLKRNE